MHCEDGVALAIGKHKENVQFVGYKVAVCLTLSNLSRSDPLD
jgi:hypothetical protein